MFERVSVHVHTWPIFSPRFAMLSPTASEKIGSARIAITLMVYAQGVNVTKLLQWRDMGRTK